VWIQMPQTIHALLCIVVSSFLINLTLGCGCSAATRSFLDDAGVLHASDSEQVVAQTTEHEGKSGMVLIPGSSFRMGTDDGKGYAADGEGPSRKVTLTSFWMDETEVTNEKFAKFIDDTKHVTEAETFGWSFVFLHFIPNEIQEKITQAVKGAEWWLPVEGATWRNPEGPGSDLSSPFPSPSTPLAPHDPAKLHVNPNRWNHPVIHVSWNDAVAYCKWIGKRLPTEAEWEYASRAGLKRKPFAWGDELVPNGTHRMNVWQGAFPDTNTIEDSHYGPAPVRTFEPNAYGLYNMAGNVWEWCSDWFKTTHTTEPSTNPTGPTSGKQRVMRGGSFLCHESYCYRYRTSSRSQNTPDSSTYNLGFRCAASQE